MIFPISFVLTLIVQMGQPVRNGVARRGGELGGLVAIRATKTTTLLPFLAPELHSHGENEVQIEQRAFDTIAPFCCGCARLSHRLSLPHRPRPPFRIPPLLQVDSHGFFVFATRVEVAFAPPNREFARLD